MNSTQQVLHGELVAERTLLIHQLGQVSGYRHLLANVCRVCAVCVVISQVIYFVDVGLELWETDPVKARTLAGFYLLALGSVVKYFQSHKTITLAGIVGTGAFSLEKLIGVSKGVWWGVNVQQWLLCSLPLVVTVGFVLQTFALLWQKKSKDS
jgi:hypothetical protein